MLFLDINGAMLDYVEIIDDDVHRLFLPVLQKNIDKHMAPIRSQHCNVPHLTDKDWSNYNSKLKCERCHERFTTKGKKVKHRHHDHNIWPTIDKITRKVISGNYIAALCMSCNIRISNKRERVPCIFHNLSYDMNVLMNGIIAATDKKHLRKIRILPKSASGYYNVKYGKNISFIDSYSFLPNALSQLVKLKCQNVSDVSELAARIPLTVEAVKKQFGDTVVKHLMTGKQLYPYKMAKNKEELLNIKNYPDKTHFYDDLNEREVSNDDYAAGKLVWDSIADIVKDGVAPAAPTATATAAGHVANCFRKKALYF